MTPSSPGDLLPLFFLFHHQRRATSASTSTSDIVVVVVVPERLPGEDLTVVPAALVDGGEEEGDDGDHEPGGVRRWGLVRWVGRDTRDSDISGCAYTRRLRDVGIECP